ncbi:MAG: retroviral-like aspartic protease family protein [Novosphingobium sp.]
MAIHAFLGKLLPLAMAIPILAGQDGTQQASDVDVIATGKDQYDRLTVPVRIGAQGPFDFMIDTGAQNTVLSTALATRLALPNARRVKLTGIAGSTIVDTVEVEQIDLGKRSYYGVLAPLLERGDMGADGIIGLDSLQGQRVVIDFRKREIAVADAKALGGNRGYEIVVTARRRSGQLIMAHAKIDGIDVDVVIDTGAESSIGNRALQAAMLRRGKAETTELRSVTGQTIVADIGFGKKLQLGEMSFQNVMIAYADAPPFAVLGLDKKPALFLGMRDMRALDRIAIDFQARKVYFDVPQSAYQ